MILALVALKRTLKSVCYPTIPTCNVTNVIFLHSHYAFAGVGTPGHFKPSFTLYVN